MLPCVSLSSHKRVAQENTKSTVLWRTLLPHCHLLQRKSNEGDGIRTLNTQIKLALLLKTRKNHPKKPKQTTKKKSMLDQRFVPMHDGSLSEALLLLLVSSFVFLKVYTTLHVSEIIHYSVAVLGVVQRMEQC